MSHGRLRVLLPIVVLAFACAADPGEPGDDPQNPDDAESEPVRELGDEVTDLATDTPGPPAAADDAPWTPPPFTATRFGVFYQVGVKTLEAYAELPRSPEHAWIFSHSHANGVPASRALADQIHGARADYLYAPAFDLNDYPGWATASDAQVRAWASDFRDRALEAHADLFALNEAPTLTPSRPDLQRALARILRALNAPAADGRRLRGVLFLTHGPSMPANWTSPGVDFWRAADATTVAVVAEHYHGQGFVCGSSDDALANHLFALRSWLDGSRDPAKVSIANTKFTVLHSSRYAPGPSGWQGADADETSLPAFHRALSKLARVTRQTPGGVNRISFAPSAPSITDSRVHPRIAALLRWHYGARAAAPAETACIAGAAVNCSCQ